MKLVKKLISAVCALGMIATMTSAFVVQAAETPTIKLDTTYDEETKEGTISVRLLNFDKTTDGEFEDFFITGVQVGIHWDPSIFDDSYYTTGRGGTIEQNFVWGDRFAGNGISSKAYENDMLLATWANTTTTEGQAISGYYDGQEAFSDIEFVKINFKKLTDDPIDLSELFGDVMVTTRQYNSMDWDINDKVDNKFGNMTNCATTNYDAPELDPIKVVGPVIQSVGDGPFTATGDEADVMPDQRAAAAIAEIPAVGEDDTYNAVKWTITVDGSQYDKTFGLANLDTSADMKMGLIVEYSTNDAETVTIDKAEYATVTE